MQTKNIYTEEFQQLKSYDEVQSIEPYKGYDFIETAGHGYLVVKKEDVNYKTAKKILTKSGCGYQGKNAIYLEEDSEAPAFINTINLA